MESMECRRIHSGTHVGGPGAYEENTFSPVTIATLPSRLGKALSSISSPLMVGADQGSDRNNLAPNWLVFPLLVLLHCAQGSQNGVQTVRSKQMGKSEVHSRSETPARQRTRQSGACSGKIEREFCEVYPNEWAEEMLFLL